MGKKAGLFGVAFDPLPSKESLLIKHMYIKAQAFGKIAPPNYLDPYTFFSNNLPEVTSESFSLLGKVSIPTWLQPKPQVSDVYELTLSSLNHFMKSGGCLLIADKVHDFVVNNGSSRTLGMIGVDHSSTYGAISALTECGEEELGLIVIDSHLDAVPMILRHGLIDYVKESNSSFISPGLHLESNYQNISLSECREWSKLNPENFLLHILDHNLIKPNNLVVVGITDYPSKDFEESDNLQVRDYVNYFKSLEAQGVRIIPKSALCNNGTKNFTKALKNFTARKVYISLDIDVGSFSSVYACRFLSSIGLSFEQIRDVFQSLFSAFKGDLTLAGFDIMEVDIHKLGAKIDSSHIDQTSALVNLFLDFVGQVIQ